MSNLHRTTEAHKCDPADPWSWDDVIELGEHAPVLLPIHPDDDDYIDIDPTAPIFLPFDGVDYIGGDDLVPLD